MKYFKSSTLASAILVATTTALTGCGGDSSSDPIFLGSSSSASKGSVLKMSGGQGGADGGWGGDGDYLEVYNYGGGDVRIGGGQKPDTSYKKTDLSTVQTELGDKPLMVTTDLTIDTFATDAASKPAAGVLYLTDSDGGWHIRESDGNTAAFSEAEVFTGIDIAKGATLTLGTTSGNDAFLYVDHDILVKGTLASVEINAGTMGGMNLHPGSLIVWPTGVVTTAGVQPGQDGGGLDIDTDYSIINFGVVQSYGADNDAGPAGNGGTQNPDADYVFENNGVFDAHGGDSADDIGGDAGYIDAYSYYGDVLNSGDIFCHGGFGELGGGDGDDIYLYADTVGDVKSSGHLTINGGDAGAGTGADGGDADYLDAYSYGGAIHLAGRIDGWGGTTEAPDGDGGDANNVYIYNSDGGHYETAPEEGIFVSAKMNLEGGDAVADGTGDGGYGGYLYAEIDGDEERGQDVVLRYRKVDMAGGDGNYGGDGGDLYVYNYEGYNNALDIYMPSGTNDIRANVFGNGGDVVADATGSGYGGEGGEIYIESDYYEASGGPEFGLTKVSGNLYFPGGESWNTTSNFDADGDYAWIWGYNGVTFKNIDISGGDDRGNDGGTDGYGGDGGDADIYSELGDVRGGRVDVSGGDGEYDGGDADDFDAEAVNLAFTLIANGGDADPTLAGSTGGDVEDVYIWSENGQGGVRGVKVQREPGEGETPGDTDGYYLILGSTCSGTGC